MTCRLPETSIYTGNFSLHVHTCSGFLSSQFDPSGIHLAFCENAMYIICAYIHTSTSYAEICIHPRICMYCIDVMFVTRVNVHDLCMYSYIHDCQQPSAHIFMRHRGEQSQGLCWSCACIIISISKHSRSMKCLKSTDVNVLSYCILIHCCRISDIQMSHVQTSTQTSEYTQKHTPARACAHKHTRTHSTGTAKTRTRTHTARHNMPLIDAESPEDDCCCCCSFSTSFSLPTVCVCVRERERERDRHRTRERERWRERERQRHREGICTCVRVRVSVCASASASVS